VKTKNDLAWVEFKKSILKAAEEMDPFTRNSIINALLEEFIRPCHNIVYLTEDFKNHLVLKDDLDKLLDEKMANALAHHLVKSPAFEIKREVGIDMNYPGPTISYTGTLRAFLPKKK
jgi:hypothetical protein